MAYADPEVRKQRDRERFRRRTEDRIAAGLYPRCGEQPPAPERSVCEPCAAKRNAAGRTRDARLRAEGKPRRDPVRANEYGRVRSRREQAARQAGNICIRCGKRAPVEAGSPIGTPFGALVSHPTQRWNHLRAL